MTPRQKLDFIIQTLNSCVTLDQVDSVNKWFNRLLDEQYFGGLRERTNIVYDYNSSLESKLQDMGN